jgi:glycosidase
MYEFHISKVVRDRYQFEQSLFSTNGNVIFANFHAVRLFAQKMNQHQDLVRFPERAVKAGQVNAMGMIDEILHHVVSLYSRQRNPDAMPQAMAWLEEHLGKAEIDKVLLTFVQEFPPSPVYRRELSPLEYLSENEDGKSNRVVALEEMLMLWVANKNPANAPYLELFDDSSLIANTPYLQVISGLNEFFETQPRFGPDRQTLIEMLRAPAIAVPHSLTGQLDFIRERWADLLGRYLYRLLTSLDLIQEEENAALRGMAAGGGPGPIPIPVYDAAKLAETEPERFSLDRDWMPRLVLMAKNTYVWLFQLSKEYGRPITRLDQIPDEELDRLARFGFSGLWLIGLWERSNASARIKQMMGNPDAIASAYSLANYQIAADLGGDEAYRNLRDRAWQRGIRLASDMVPNHMGIDSSWVLYNPDRFVSLDYSPFPSYSFTGENLSPDPRVGIYLEDHYFDKTDAAVVFKRVDHSNGDTRYIYHGNDGTSMPWNDTAQLNYLNPEVREAVIQTILDVARRFPIIRFDAAMTLAKRHYQRLWFPEPGTGGAIPSRAEHGLTKEQFDNLMPIEFWREVVDRAAVEAPDTLLLAEAFWLMEGYFVRTLGMHRVYNSAFMNLLRNEENSKYRLVMKNTLEFDPEILKRYVNFMNNPDERTAVDQFGKGDKYFGICILMATMPGLPMFGHGQIEGYSEKYGMEFRKPMWDESVDTYLVERHEREIVPLLHRRALFAGVDHFLLYDVFSPGGQVNEDVFAYSNGLGNERALVVYHNKFASAQGWIRTSVGFSARLESGERQIIQRTIGEGLNLHPGENTFLIYRDSIAGLEYIRPSREVVENGLFVDLQAYKYFVFVDFREVQDDPLQSYRHLCDYLSGRGVPSVSEALRELMLQPIQNPFLQIANAGYFQYLLANRISSPGTGTAPVTTIAPGLLEEAIEKYSSLVQAIAYYTGASPDLNELMLALRYELETILSLSIFAERHPVPGSRTFPTAVRYLQSGLVDDEPMWLVLFTWAFLHNLNRIAGEIDPSQTLSWMDEWQLNRLLSEAYRSLGVSEPESWKMVATARLLIAQEQWYRRLGVLPLDQILQAWLADAEIQQYLGVNRFQDVLWFNRESLEQFVWWMAAITTVHTSSQPRTTSTKLVESVLGSYEIAQMILAAEKKSAYQVQKLLKAAEQESEGEPDEETTA